MGSGRNVEVNLIGEINMAQKTGNIIFKALIILCAVSPTYTDTYSTLYTIQ